MSARGWTAGALSLVAAGAIGGGLALAMSQDNTRQPVEVHQVVSTETATPSTTTTATTATVTPTATKATISTPKASTRVQRVAPEPSAETTPEPVQTTPSSTSSVRQPPPIIPGNGLPYCGGTTVCTTK